MPYQHRFMRADTFLQWHINPCAETYHAMPEWLRPISRRHQAIGSAIGKKAVLLHERSTSRSLSASADSTRPVPCDRFVLETADGIAAFAPMLTVNWPLCESELFCQNGITGEMEVNPLFEAHILDTDNWTFDATLVGLGKSRVGDAKLR